MTLMRQLPDECVDLVVTSPPYNMGRGYGDHARRWNGYHGYGDDLPYEAYVAWQRECISEMLRVLTPAGAIFYNHAGHIQNGIWQSPMQDILREFPVRQPIIWKRSGGTNHNRGYFLRTTEFIYLVARPQFQLVSGHQATDVWKSGRRRRAGYGTTPRSRPDCPRRRYGQRLPR